MAAVTACRLLCRGARSPIHLAGRRHLSVSRQWLFPDFCSTTRLELNPDEAIGSELFSKIDNLSRSMTWEETVPYILSLHLRLKKSSVPLLLDLDNRGLIKEFGRCAMLKHFLAEGDAAMIDYCMKGLEPTQYSCNVFASTIYYLEMNGRHDEADVIVKGSFDSSSRTAFTTYLGTSPKDLEVIERAVARTFPNARLPTIEVLSRLPRSYLAQELHDRPAPTVTHDAHFRAKTFMTRAEFRQSFEKQIWVEMNAHTACRFTKVDNLFLKARAANARYIGKVASFVGDQVKQFEDGIVDYVTKRQALLRESVFNPEGLDSGEYTPGDYYTDALFLLFDPEKTAQLCGSFFYEHVIMNSVKVSQDTALRLVLDICACRAGFMDILREPDIEQLYRMYEALHYDTSEQMACLPTRTFVLYLQGKEGVDKLQTKEHILIEHAVRAISQVLLNTLHIGKFRRLNGEWARTFRYNPDDHTLHIDPALDVARFALKTADIEKRIEPDKMPVEFVPSFRTTATGGGGKLVTHGSNHMNALTPTKSSSVIQDAIDAIGQVAFKLDPRCVEVIIHRLNELRLDRPDYILCIPPALDTLAMLKQLGKEATGLADALIAQQAVEEYRGMRQDIGNRMILANYFKDERPFWALPVLDFRGRYYSQSSFLASTSPDMVRGMLRFATGVPLGNNGWDWLKVHLANLHGGCKKRSREQKIEFINERMDDLIKTVDSPMEGFQWWHECDSPVQSLICACEIVDALRSGNPSEFVSTLPVHQDGSCNGMQHYSALGRDVEGAKLVSLSAVPSSLDLYSSVAKKVEEKLIQEIGNKQLPLNIRNMAKKSLPYASRKIVKQTVMTTVYGVTRSGAEVQIDRSIKRLYGQTIPDLNRISPHMVKTIFEVLDEVFAVARKIQRWLLSCVARVSGQGYYMTWVTPLGLAVEQPYSKVPLGHDVKSNMSLPRFVIDAGGQFDPKVLDVSASKHNVAFPPNFIHSLDATHMMMTAMEMKRQGLAYGAVHDSYWAHAAHIDDMSRIIREQFVALYQQPIIESLASQLQQYFGDKGILWKEDVFMNYPKPGQFDITEVLRSERFFS